MTLGEGTILQDRYQIVSPLKSGGMGAIFLAKDLHLQDQCAIKLMHADSDEWSLRRFREEAQVLTQLHHPNIPQIRDYFVLGQEQQLTGENSDSGPETLKPCQAKPASPAGQAVIVMQFIDGENLQNELYHALEHSQSGLKIGQVLNDALAVLSVLEYLHQQNPPLIHRDLKPANLIRDRQGKLWVVDFGLARPASEQTQTSAGTLMYCPPEQMLGKADPRSDIYSLAATLYILLTGQNIQLGKTTPLAQLRPDIAAHVSGTIDKCLRLDPDGRCQSAAQMHDWLTVPHFYQASLGPRRKRFPLWQVAVVGVLVLATLSLQLLRGTKRPDATSTVSPGPVRPSGPQVKLVGLPESMGIGKETLSNPDDYRSTAQKLWEEAEPALVAANLSGTRFQCARIQPDGRWKVAAGLLLSESQPPPPGLTGVRFPGGRFARLTLLGAEPDLIDGGRLTQDWLKTQGMEPGSCFFEIYRINHSNQSEAAKWETDILWALKSNKKQPDSKQKT